MLKHLRILGVLLNVVGGALLVFALLIQREAPLKPEGRSAVAAQEADSGLPGFKLGVPRIVDLLGARVYSVDWRSPEDYREQVRDWLLYLVVTAAADSARDVLDITAEMSPVRRGFALPSTQYQHGEVRSAYLGDGTVVLLIPQDRTAEVRSDTVAQTADRHSILQGERIQRALIVEYGLQAEHLSELVDGVFGVSMIPLALPTSATLTLTEEISANRLYSEEFGWVERTIRVATDLESFIQSTDDLIFAESGLDGFQVAGREYKARPYGRLTLEHLATLWQARNNRQEAERRDKARQEALWRRWMVRAVDDRLANQGLPDQIVADLRQLARTGSVSLPPNAPSSYRIQLQTFEESLREELSQWFGRLWRAWGTCEWQEFKLQVREIESQASPDAGALQFARHIREFEAYRMGLDERERSLLRGAGFSLDSEYDFEILSKKFEEYLKTGHPQIIEALEPFQDALRDSFKEQNKGLLQCMLDAANKANNREIAREINAQLLDPASYQVARYDGGLAGTEVGQILFLTDLLAKLLDMDFDGIFQAYFQNTEIDWRPTVYTDVAKSYRLQMEELPGTRIWFGEREESYASLRGGRRLMFDPISARVYALSSGAVSQENQKETQPNYLSGQFVDWFNHYYHRVAAVEPHYDRLNQLVKWSRVLHGPAYKDLSFLAQQHVRTDIWFPDWVREQGNQPFAKSWIDCFHERGHYRKNVETMFVLHVGWQWRKADGTPEDPRADRWCNGVDNADADDLRVWSIRGGVSLPSRIATEKLGPDAAIFARRPLLRRANAIDGTTRSPGKLDELTFQPEYNAQRTVAVELNNGNLSGRVVRKTQAVSQDTTGEWKAQQRSVFHRGTSTEIRQRPFEEAIALEPEARELTIASRIGDNGIARTTVTANESTFRISQENLAIETGQSLSMRLSRLPEQDWPSFFALQPTVRMAAITGDGRHFVQLRNGQRWLEFSRETTPSVEIAEGWTQRTSRPNSIIDELILESRKLGGTVPEFLLGQETKVVNLRLVGQQDVMEKLGAAERLTVRHRVSDSGALSLEIRGPPGDGPPPPPSGRAIQTAGSDREPHVWFVPSKKEIDIRLTAPGARRSLDRLLDSLAKSDVPEIHRAGVGTGDPIVLPAFKRQDRVSLPDVRKLNEERIGFLKTGLDNDPMQRLRQIEGNRSHYLVLIERAQENGQAGFARQLVDTFSSTYRPTLEEAARLALVKLPSENVPYRKLLTEFVKRDPGSVTEEIAKAVERFSAEGKPFEASELMTLGRRYAAEISELRNKPRRIDFAVTHNENQPALAARVWSSPESIRPARQAELDAGARVLISDKLHRQGVLPDKGIEVSFPDAMVMKIEDPQRLVNAALSEFKADEIILGGVGRFRRAEPAKPIVSAERSAADYQKILDTVAKVRFEPPLDPTEPFLFGGSGDDGNGGDNGDDGAAEDPIGEHDEDATSTIFVVDCSEVEEFLAYVGPTESNNGASCPQTDSEVDGS